MLYSSPSPEYLERTTITESTALLTTSPRDITERATTMITTAADVDNGEIKFKDVLNMSTATMLLPTAVTATTTLSSMLGQTQQPSDWNRKYTHMRV